MPDKKKLLAELQSALAEPEDDGSGFFQGLMDIPESLYEHVSKTGKSASEKLKKGDYPGAFHDVAAPVVEPITGLISSASNLIKGRKPMEVTPPSAIDFAIEATGVPANRVRKAYEEGDYSRLAGQGLAAAGTIALGHKFGKKVGPKAPIEPFKLGNSTEFTIPEYLKPPNVDPIPQSRALVATPRPKQPTFIAGPSEAGGIVAPPNVPPNVAAEVAGLKTGGIPGDVIPRAVDLGEVREAQRIAGLKYTQAEHYKGTSMDVNSIGPYENTLPRQSGDPAGGFNPENVSGGLDYPLDIVPNRLRPRTSQTDALRRLPEAINPEPIGPSESNISFSDGALPDVEMPPNMSPEYLGEGRAIPGEPQLPSAVKSPKVKTKVEPPSPVQMPEPPPIKGSNLTPKEAIQRWAWGRDAAKSKGEIEAAEFKDLQDPTLIDQFQTGNRQGSLGKVQALLDNLFKKEKAAGLLDDEAYKENYLRQYWDFEASSPEAIAAFNKTRIARTPGFAKESTFETYAAGKEAGMVPKYKTIPEIIEARVAESTRAIRNKELYDWLDENKYIRKGGIVQSPDTWDLIGPHRNDIKKLVTNYLTFDSPIKPIADVASMSKNISLGGGLPGTKYNMHAWNTARADAKLKGFLSAGRRLFTDLTGRKAAEWYDSMPKSEKDLIPELIENGWVHRPISDSGSAVNIFESGALNKGTNFVTGKLGITSELPGTISKAVDKVAGKGVDLYQKGFERPLFERALPAMNAQRTLEAFHALEPEIGRVNALRAAARIGNEFYGGVNKALRSKTKVDLGRIVVLAPDWLESRLRLAAHEWKSTGKVLIGKGDPVDKIYAKSFGRGAAITATGVATGGSLLGNKSNRDIAAIPLGDVDELTHRKFPTMTSADEGQRLLLQAPINALEGNPLAIKDILAKNRISIPFSTFINVVKGQDNFGNPLAKQDKFGRPISGAQSIMNYGAEASRPLQHQAVLGLIGWMKGELSAEQAIAMGAELPLSYSKGYEE